MSQMNSKNRIHDLLGEPPWDEELLRKYYFQNFRETREFVQMKHPGSLVYTSLKSIRLSLDVFLNAVADLISSINRFKGESAKPGFWNRPYRQFVEELEIAIQRGIASSAMCAMALVDHTREFSKSHTIPDYDSQIKHYFSERKEHRFIHSLRRYITHIKLTKAQLIKTYQSIIIDGIFLENAVKSTRNIYRRVYPQKILNKPNIYAIVEQLLKYTHVERKQEVNCYLIYSYDFSLEYVVDIEEMTEDDFLMEERLNFVGREYNLYKLKTQDIVSFKVEKQLSRIINVENVLLVADDFAYVPYLQELKNKGVEVVVFQHSENSGSRMYHRFNWADITYPLALAMGLEAHEL